MRCIKHTAWTFHSWNHTVWHPRPRCAVYHVSSHSTLQCWLSRHQDVTLCKYWGGVKMWSANSVILLSSFFFHFLSSRHPFPINIITTTGVRNCTINPAAWRWKYYALLTPSHGCFNKRKSTPCKCARANRVALECKFCCRLCELMEQCEKPGRLSFSRSCEEQQVHPLQTSGRTRI